MASIKHRNGSYLITVSNGYDINHKKITVTTTYKPDLTKLTKKTKDARDRELQAMVQSFADDFERRVKGGLILDGESMTLQDFIARWLIEYAEVKIQPTTLEGYKILIDSKILPELGHLKLTEIKPGTVNAFYSKLLKPGAKKDGNAYSLGSVRKIAGVLSSIMGTAKTWGAIKENPCTDVKPSIAEKYTEEKTKAWTPEQTVCFLQFIENPTVVKVPAQIRNKGTAKEYTVSAYEEKRPISLQIRLLMNLALFTAMRKGEILALQWSDIDFTNGTITVCKALSVVNGKPVIKVPKTKNSNRVIPIPAQLIDLLKTHKAEQQKTMMMRRDYWHKENWIFTQDNGKQMNYSTPYEALTGLIDNYNAALPKNAAPLPKISFHALRHTSLSALVVNGVDVVTVSSIAGHSSPTVTEKIYLHSFDTSKQQAAEKLGNIFSAQPNTASKKQA